MSVGLPELSVVDGRLIVPWSSRRARPVGVERSWGNDEGSELDCGDGCLGWRVTEDMAVDVLPNSGLCLAQLGMTTPSRF